MKTTITILVMMTGWISGSGQVPTFREFFKQKETQKEYLVKQIALLQVYLGLLRKGYDIASGGLAAIGEMKHGKFALDNGYLGSLAELNPAVKNPAKVDDILLHYGSIVSLFAGLSRDPRIRDNLHPREIRYVNAVHRNLLRECGASLDDLRTILIAGETEMSDDERLRRLDSVCLDMAGKYSFARSFTESTRLLCMERARQQHQVEGLGDIYSAR